MTSTSAKSIFNIAYYPEDAQKAFANTALVDLVRKTLAVTMEGGYALDGEANGEVLSVLEQRCPALLDADYGEILTIVAVLRDELVHQDTRLVANVEKALDAAKQAGYDFKKADVFQFYNDILAFNPELNSFGFFKAGSVLNTLCKIRNLRD